MAKHEFSWGTMTVLRGSIVALGEAMRKHPDGRIRIYKAALKRAQVSGEASAGNALVTHGVETLYTGPVSSGWESPLCALTKGWSTDACKVKLEVARRQNPRSENWFVVTTVLVEVLPKNP